MPEIAIHIECDAVQRDPALYANADGGDLVLASCAFVRASHPHADAIMPPLAAYAQARERANDPFLETVNEAAHITPAPVQIEHHIDDPLSGAVIRELAAASAGVHRKIGRQHLLALRARSRGIEWRVLEQPNELGTFSGRNGGGA